MSIEITPAMQARRRVLWLTDHPGCTLADYERVRAPSPRTAATRREHSAYLDWLNTPNIMQTLLAGTP